jgi:hypothetical protein
MDDIIYLKPDNCIFYKNNGGFLGLKFDDEDYKKVLLYRSFPFTFPNNFVSVRDNDNKEIGIIDDMMEFQKDTILLFEEELKRRYLLPTILNIKNIKDEFGYSYWEVITEIGERKFTIKRDNSSFLNVKDNLILITDVDGNRYDIKDYTKLDEKSYKLIELLL